MARSAVAMPIVLTVMIIGLLYSAATYAQQEVPVSSTAQLSNEQSATKTEQPEAEDSGFELLSDLPTKNQIPLFNNRFRIDDGVEEVTLLFFRKRGSSSVVLVKPDGSKINFRSAKQQQVRWHDASSYDLIQIKKPMPGPWQAVGSILPESRVMLLTNIKLDVDPLPQNMMVGETIKVTARLTNGDEPINAREFREVLLLEVIFSSTNNPEAENFGRGVVQVAQFRDDGKGFDERARDGVFTGEFQLKFSAGEWLPKYIVRTPLYTRELEQKPVTLKPAPIAADITAAEAVPDDQPAETAKPHHIEFKVTDDSVKAESVLLQGRIRYPNGEIGEFALNEAGNAPRELSLHNRGHGSYILEVSAYGETQDGREFMLSLPEISFVVKQPTFKAPVLEELPQHVKDQIAAEQAAAAAAAAEQEEGFPWGLVILANVVILGGGSIAIWFVLTDRKLADLKFWQKKKPAPVAKEQPESKAENKKTSTNAQKNNDMDDILDLTLPDD